MKLCHLYSKYFFRNLSVRDIVPTIPSTSSVISIGWIKWFDNCDCDVVLFEWIHYWDIPVRNRYNIENHIQNTLMTMHRLSRICMRGTHMTTMFKSVELQSRWSCDGCPTQLRSKHHSGMIYRQILSWESNLTIYDPIQVYQRLSISASRER